MTKIIDQIYDVILLLLVLSFYAGAGILTWQSITTQPRIMEALALAAAGVALSAFFILLKQRTNSPED